MKFFLLATRKGIGVWVSGKRLSLPGFPNIKVILHKDLDYNAGWRVSDELTGASMSKVCETKKDALKGAQAAVGRYGVSEYYRRRSMMPPIKDRQFADSWDQPVF